MNKKQVVKFIDEMPDEVSDFIRQNAFVSPWHYDPDTNERRDPDKEADKPGRDQIQSHCWTKALESPHINTSVRGLAGRHAGAGFGVTCEIPIVQRLIDEIELDPRNRLYLYYPKYVTRAIIEGELFLLLTCHFNGFIEVDFVEPCDLQGGDDGIIWHPSKTGMPLVYMINNGQGEEHIPSIFLARYPKLMSVAAQNPYFSESAMNSSRKPRTKAFQPLGGFFRFIVSWDKSWITKRNMGHIRTVLQWVELYENLKKWEAEVKKAASAYVWYLQMEDPKLYKLWLSMDEADKKKSGLMAPKTPGSTLMLPPGMKFAAVNPTLPKISDEDRDVLRMISSGIDEPEDVMTGESRGTSASVKESRGPWSDRTADEVDQWEKFIRHDFWGNLFFLRSAIVKFPRTHSVRECIGFKDREPVFGMVKKSPEQLLEVNLPTSEVLQIENKARALLGVKHGPISDTLGIPKQEVAKRLGFANYRTQRLRYETEGEKYPDTPLMLDAEAIQETIEAEPKRPTKKKPEKKPKEKAE